jgi:hypothetical protein
MDRTTDTTKKVQRKTMERLRPRRGVEAWKVDDVRGS